MAVLKKIKASTLMETMVATVLIVIIFMIASLVMNTVFSTSINGNKQALKEKLSQLEYQYKNQLITVPYYEDWDVWQIEMLPQSAQDNNYILLEAKNTKTPKTVQSYITDDN